jgi:hypothetical protein
MLYFFPHTTVDDLLDQTDATRVRIKRDFLQRYGLDYVWRDVTRLEHISYQLMPNGIGSECAAMGVLVVAFPQGQVAMRHPRQDWHQIDDGKYWVATDPQHPDTPERLQRKTTTDGYYFNAYDEIKPLIVPVVRSPRQSKITMRQSVYTDQNGQVHYKPKQCDQWLWNGVGRAWNLINNISNDDSPEPLTIENGGLQLAVDLLGVNYRYGRAEQQVLGWLDNQNWIDVLYLACDLPLIREMQQLEMDKKKALANALLNSGRGPEGN